VSSKALDALRVELRAIQSSYASLPVLDDRHADEILGYDQHGLPA
jgi:antitoxin VapB